MQKPLKARSIRLTIDPFVCDISGRIGLLFQNSRQWNIIMKSKMTFIKWALALSCLLFVASAYSAPNDPFRQDGSSFDIESNERDWTALRDYLNTKRDIPLEEKDDNLAISGDVRFEYRRLNEYLHGLSMRGGNASERKAPYLPISRNDFDVEMNLKFDYIMDQSWAVAHVQYDNSAGVKSEEYFSSIGEKDFRDCKGWFGSNTNNKLALRKAYMGYNFVDTPTTRFDMELGRRGNLYHVFDSQLQFLSVFDGVLFHWKTNWENVSEVYVKAAGFVVDERTSHLAYAVETGLLNIMDSGFDVKYSFIDWHTYTRHGRGICLNTKQPACKYRKNFVKDPTAFKYQISQFTLVYHFDESLFCRPAKLYSAVLFNHMLHTWRYLTYRTPVLADDGSGNVVGHINHYSHAWSNLGWNVGFKVGEVKKEGDWALEVQYQVVGATAVPGQDMGGIGNGNVHDFTLTHDNLDNTNFKGWKVEGLYAFTDQITLDMIVEASSALDKRIGGEHDYRKLELEAIYAF